MNRRQFYSIFYSTLITYSALAMTSRQAVDAVKASVTGALVQASAASTTNYVESAPAEMTVKAAGAVVAAGTFVRPVIAAGPDGRLYVAAEGPGMASIVLYVFDGKRWSGGTVVTASMATALRCYVPDIEVGADGTCWVSFRWGKKEGGRLHGPGVWIRAPNGTGKLIYPHLTTGAARIEPDGAGVVLMSKNGAFGRIDKSGTVTSGGMMKAGLGTGEKFDLDTQGEVWAVAINGCTAQPSSITVGTAAGGQRVTSFDHGVFPGLGNDLNYTSVLLHKGTAWAAMIESGKLRLNALTGTALRWPATAPASLGAGTMDQRCPPRLVAAKAGPSVIWRRGQEIVMADIEKGLKGAAPVRLASGIYPSAATGPDGRVHLVYVDGAGLHYKEVAQ
jgi:hypothetical protein